MLRVQHGYTNGCDIKPYEFDVDATPEELSFFAENGYLVIENAITAELLETLRTTIMRQARNEYGESRESTYDRTFGGHYLVGLLDKDEIFHTVVQFPRTVSIIRAMLGARIQSISCNARVTYPGTSQETLWHVDNPCWIEPRPRFLTYPSIVSGIYFLDDVTPDSGVFSIVPGTHELPAINGRLQMPPKNYYGHIDGQVDVYAKAGTLIMIHGGLWHKAGPNTENGALRRSLLVGYSPIYLKDAKFGGLSSWGGELTTKALRETDDPLLHDLFGQGNAFYV